MCLHLTLSFISWFSHFGVVLATVTMPWFALLWRKIYADAHNFVPDSIVYCFSIFFVVNILYVCHGLCVSYWIKTYDNNNHRFTAIIYYTGTSRHIQLRTGGLLNKMEIKKASVKKVLWTTPVPSQMTEHHMPALSNVHRLTCHSKTAGNCKLLNQKC